MEGDKITFEMIDHYIANYSPDIQNILEMIRGVVKEAAPFSPNVMYNLHCKNALENFLCGIFFI